MKCPIDNSELSMTDRQGIEIDYCLKCRGVWLDRGELDKIIERSTEDTVDKRTITPKQSRYEEPQSNRTGYDSNNDNNHQYGKKRKKEGFIGELFDF